MSVVTIKAMGRSMPPYSMVKSSPISYKPLSKMPETTFQKSLLTFLIQVVFYALLWLWEEYAALFVSVTFSAIAFFVLLIALIAEWIERSKVPPFFFLFLLISVVTPLIFFMILWLGGLNNIIS